MTRDTCRNCGKSGHWAIDCPDSVVTGVTEMTGQTVPKKRTTVRKPETYIEVEMKDQKSGILLDTGCCCNILPSEVVDKDDIIPDTTKLQAVNGTNIRIDGAVILEVKVATKPLKTKFLVSPDISEPILGAEFLYDNGCQWNFSAKTINIAGEEVPLLENGGPQLLRRIYVDEQVTVPPACEMNVPVQLRRLGWKTSSTDWVIEAKELADGVYVARTLLSDKSEFPAVRVMNTTKTEYQVKNGLFIADADVILPRDIYERTGPGQRGKPAVQPSCAQQQARRVRDNLTGGATDVEDKYEHIRPVIDSLPDSLTEQERQLAIDVVKKNADVFSKSKFDLGRTTLVQHRIDVGSNRPFKEPLRMHPKAYLDAIDNEVEAMLKSDIIEKSRQPLG